MENIFKDTVDHLIENVEESIKHAVMKSVSHSTVDGRVVDIYFTDGVSDEFLYVNDEVYDYLALLTDSEIKDLFISHYIEANIGEEKSRNLIEKKCQEHGFRKMRSEMLDILISEVMSCPRISVYSEECRERVLKDYAEWLSANGENVKITEMA